MKRVAINGFGRIGRLTFRRLLQNTDVEVVAINDLASNDILLHLLKYDSVHGSFGLEVRLGEDSIIVDGREIKMFAQPDPEKLPWKELKVDYIVESTGFFTTLKGASKHILAGAKKVVISAPAKDKEIPTIVIGVNDHTLTGQEQVISNASCTTNCLAPMVKVLDEAFGLEKGFMTTVHAYTSTQSLVDAPHKDFRRARSAASNIIPTTTGAAKTVELVYPKVTGKLYGIAARVPVPDGSLTDFTAILSKNVSREEINAKFKEASEGKLKGILEYTSDPIVSSDIIGNPHSNIFDSMLTYAMGSFVKVVGWYDNEYGYASRTADLINIL
ncbi:MAG: glyceraldehyde 3-phosphate dehydrogenase [Patiriisocius sp.]|jgi:glyceraldehyde 3-phosphate dehydrogenase